MYGVDNILILFFSLLHKIKRAYFGTYFSPGLNATVPDRPGIGLSDCLLLLSPSLILTYLSPELIATIPDRPGAIKHTHGLAQTPSVPP